MNATLQACFEMQYPSGPLIRANLEQLTEGFSVTVLFGPSGCGKSTVLRCLAGLNRPSRGFIRYGRQAWYDSETRLCITPQQRRIGLLFQDYALFPHLTVRQNVAYGLRARPAGEQRQVTTDLLAKFQLESLGDRLPQQISGGQQQRVALARVLATRPRLLLLDEPLSALDENLRRELRGQLRQLLAEFAIPVVIVTHDRHEAMALADQMVVMDAGEVLQSGSVEALFSRPATPAVAQIVGTETVVLGEVVAVEAGLATVEVGSVTVLAVAPQPRTPRVHVCIKGDDVTLQRELPAGQSTRNRWPARIVSITPEGPLMRVRLDCGFVLSALVTRSACEALQLQECDTVTACVKAASIHLIADNRSV